MRYWDNIWEKLNHGKLSGWIKKILNEHMLTIVSFSLD